MFIIMVNTVLDTVGGIQDKVLLSYATMIRKERNTLETVLFHGVEHRRKLLITNCMLQHEKEPDRSIPQAGNQGMAQCPSN